MPDRSRTGGLGPIDKRNGAVANGAPRTDVSAETALPIAFRVWYILWDTPIVSK